MGTISWTLGGDFDPLDQTSASDLVFDPSDHVTFSFDAANFDFATVEVLGGPGATYVSDTVHGVDLR